MVVRSLTLAPVFSSNMVLQREKKIELWGMAPAGEKVTVLFAGAGRCATAEQDGTWRVWLPAQKAGGPYSLSAACRGETLRLENILVGEVWLAAGQSNMELELQNCQNGKAELAASQNDAVRFYLTQKTPWLDEASLRREAENGWKICGPDTAATLSAAAYFFARRLQKRLGVPVGILGCYWGGTSAACWQSRAQLEKTAAGQEILSAYEKETAGQTDAVYEAKLAKFDADMAAWNEAVAACRAANPVVEWEELNATCGPCPWFPPAGRKSPYRPAGLLETMVKRVKPYTVRGVLWYQGEQDAPAHSGVYAELLAGVLDNWRTEWHDDTLPFLLVQLPMYIAKEDADAGKDDLGFAYVREAQQKIADTAANTYLTALTDCGEFDNVHPLDKQTVGWRLAGCALRHIYGDAAEAEAPRVAGCEAENGGVLVRFAGAKALEARGPVQGFALAGADGVFYPAEAVLRGTDVFVFCAEVPCPRAARYAFFSYGTANLYNEAGLAALPWRRDRLAHAYF